jgi:hypothetical protein
MEALKGVIPDADDATIMRMLFAQDNAASTGPAPPPRARGPNVSFTHPSFKWDAKNMWDEWEEFQTSVNKAWRMPGYSVLTDEEKISCVETWMGSRINEVIDSWSVEETATHRATYTTFMEELSTRWKPLYNEIHNELRFAECAREKTQSIQSFLDQLSRLAKKCAFGPDRICTQFIQNLNDTEMR